MKFPRNLAKTLGLIDARPAERAVAWSLWAFLVLLLVLLGATWPDWPQAMAERAAAGRKIRVIDDVQTLLWFSMAASAAAVLVLALTRKVWLNCTPVIAPLRPARCGPIWWITLAAILAGATVLRVPRLELSLYNDEEYAIRSYVHGKYTPVPGEEPRFRPTPWLDTAFLNREGNNQVLSNISSRLCLEGWKAMRGTPDRFSLTAIRIPPLLGGLGSILVIALLLRDAGLRAAALCTAAALALHPWHIRYSTEMRGYGLVLLFTTLTLFTLGRALSNRAWKWWIAFGLAEFALLATYQASIYLVAAANMTALVWIVLRDRANLQPQFCRWAVANVTGAIPTLFLMAPSVPQTLAYLSLRRSHGELSWDWARNFWSWNVLGIQWNGDAPDNPIILTVLGAFTQGNVVLFVISGMIAPVLLVLGAHRVLRQPGPSGWLLMAGTLSAGLGVIHAVHDGLYLFLWYLIFILPSFTALICAGACSAADGRSRSPFRWFPIVAWLALFAGATMPQTRIILRHGKEPLLDTVRTIYGERDPFGPRAHEVWAMGFFTATPIHAPSLLTSWTLEEFVSQMEAGIASGKPIYVDYGHVNLAVTRTPRRHALVNDPSLFEPVATLHGLEEAQFTHRCVRFVGTSESLAEAVSRLPATPEDHSNSSE